MDMKGSRVVGVPALCRRPFETRVFEPGELHESANESLKKLSEFLGTLPERPEGVDCGTEDISFRNNFHDWLAVVEQKGDGVDDALKPKQHFRKEQILKAPLITLKAVSTREAAAESQRTFGVEGIVDDAGNIFRSCVKSVKTARDDDSEEEIPGEPDSETVQCVRTCIERLASELNSPLEMITQRNTNLNGAPFRRNLLQMYRRIAKHLEECEGRVFETSPTRKKRRKHLDPEDAKLIQERIEELEKRHNAIASSGFFEEPPEEEDVDSETTKTDDDADHVQAQTEAIDDVVIELEILHPSFLKTKGTSVLALGKHTIGDVVDLCTCTTDDNMNAIEEFCNPRYVFIEGVFYVDENDEAALEDIEGIRKFCEENKCGWPLDKSKMPAARFQLASLSTPLSEIPVRASNKPQYLYVHRGACEHLIHIHNVRLLHVDDSPALKFGPCRSQTAQIKVRKCSICEKIYAAQVVYGSAMNITDPCFYCDTCYYLAHFDRQGVKVPAATGHVAYPYRGG